MKFMRICIVGELSGPTVPDLMILLGKETCLLYTSDAADERSSVDLGGRRIIKKKKEDIIRAHVRITQTTKTAKVQQIATRTLKNKKKSHRERR